MAATRFRGSASLSSELCSQNIYRFRIGSRVPIARRRRWSDAFKAEMVAKSNVPGANLSTLAERHDGPGRWECVRGPSAACSASGAIGMIPAGVMAYLASDRSCSRSPKSRQSSSTRASEVFPSISRRAETSRRRAWHRPAGASAYRSPPRGSSGASPSTHPCRNTSSDRVAHTVFAAQFRRRKTSAPSKGR